LLAVVIGAGVLSGRGGQGSGAEATGFTLPSTLPGAAPATIDYSNQVGTVATATPIQKTLLDRTLYDGLFGDDVRQLQERLKQLGFDPGPIDGAFGTMTKQAVWAFEKLMMKVPRAQATGKITPDMWSFMQDPLQVTPRRDLDGADHVEIYLPEQVLVIFQAGAPALIAHISSGQQNPDGTPYQYCEDITIDTDENGDLLPEPVTKPICGLAKTPPGIFKAGREVVGTRNGPLGSMFDPTYINQGIAIHGAINVPLEPASHGCIRVNRVLGPVVQQLIDKGDPVYIWDGKKEPEHQSKKDMQMIWDWVDTSRTTTTSTTTTTTTTIPVTSTTAAPQATTTKPPTQTTSAPTTVAATAATTTEPPPSTVVPVDDL
jgi:peptidoglycan hydrolase-like protein with peptidoglycan-binding domain